MGYDEALGVAVDALGRVYIADLHHSRVRRIDPNGTYTIVAGTGNNGSSGDGGPAVNAAIDPRNVALDNAGNLYITDYQNNRIRKVDVNGIITTVAGNGAGGFNGDGVLATNARLSFPSAAVVDNMGNLFIADSYNNRVRKVDVNGIITTVAGTGALQSGGDGGLAVNTPLLQPEDVAVDGSGNIYIAEFNARIRKVGVDGIITTIAGNGTFGFKGDGGLAVNALFGRRSRVDVDPSGNIYVSDRENGRVRRITSDGMINTIAGGFSGDGGQATNAFIRKRYFLNSPSNLTVDKHGNVYVSDRFGDRIRKITPNGLISTVAGDGGKGYTGDGGPATIAQLQHPRGIGFDSTGNLYIVDQYNTRLRKVDVNGVISTVAGSGEANFIDNQINLSSADFYNSNGMAVSKNGTVYIPTFWCILKITPAGVISIVAGRQNNGGFSGDGGLATNAQLNNPSSVTLDKDENLYITDTSNGRIRKVDANGIITTVAGNGNTGYGGDNIPAINSPLYYPYEVAFDPTGNMFFSESGRIRKVDRNGIITTVTEAGLLNNPNGITTDGAGNLYIADTGNRRIQKVTYPIQPTLTINRTTNCSPTSLTITAQPSGEGFSYQFGPGATQIGNTNQAVVTTSGVYSVTVSTPVFGSPAGSTSLSVLTEHMYTVKAGSWNDPTVWSCGSVPDATRKVQLLHVVNLPASYQAEAQRIKYETGSKLNVAAGAKLLLPSAP
ncbi:hypothetical protein GCM10027592_08340 [Spirosoma flavus]